MSEAMLPPAPGLFSTTTCWPHISDSLAPTTRPMVSTPPPGVNGTIMRTKRLGHAGWASAEGATVGASAEAAASETKWRRSIMRIPLFGLDAGSFDERAPLVHLGFQEGC